MASGLGGLRGGGGGGGDFETRLEALFKATSPAVPNAPKPDLLRPFNHTFLQP